MDIQAAIQAIEARQKELAALNVIDVRTKQHLQVTLLWASTAIDHLQTELAKARGEA